jgi:hypothetical protein
MAEGVSAWLFDESGVQLATGSLSLLSRACTGPLSAPLRCIAALVQPCQAACSCMLLGGRYDIGNISALSQLHWV